MRWCALSIVGLLRFTLLLAGFLSRIRSMLLTFSLDSFLLSSRSTRALLTRACRIIFQLRFCSPLHFINRHPPPSLPPSSSSLPPFLPPCLLYFHLILSDGALCAYFFAFIGPGPQNCYYLLCSLRHSNSQIINNIFKKMIK